MDQRYITADVPEALSVPGLVKTYTHFVINVKCEGIPSHLPADNIGLLPIAPYHLKALRRSRKLCAWQSNTRVERRYSELVDLRSYLGMAYPMLVFPPLPVKSSADNINTTLQSDKHLTEQRRAISNFLDDLLAMNDVVLYDATVVEALQQSREVYLQEGLVLLRNELAALTAGQAHIEDHKSIHQRASATSTAALIEGTSKVFRGLFSYVSGAPAANPYTETAKANLNGDRNYTRWLPLLQYVRELNISLGKSADELLKLQVAQDEMQVATLNVGAPLGEYNQLLQMCEWFAPLHTDVVDFAEFFSGIGASHQKEVDLWHTRVTERLRFEAAWMASVEASIEFILALFMHVALLASDPYRCGSTETSNYQTFLEKTCATLYKQVTVATGSAHNRRMHLVLSRFCNISRNALAKEEAHVTGTRYYARRLGEHRQSAEDDWAEQIQNLPWKA